MAHRKGKALADEIFSCEMGSNVDMLSSRIVACVLSNIDASGIIWHNHYDACVTDLCVCVEVPDCLTRCSG